jgi:hypothetical protein
MTSGSSALTTAMNIAVATFLVPLVSFITKYEPAKHPAPSSSATAALNAFFTGE